MALSSSRTVLATPSQTSPHLVVDPGTCAVDPREIERLVGIELADQPSGPIPSRLQLQCSGPDVSLELLDAKTGQRFHRTIPGKVEGGRGSKTVDVDAAAPPSEPAGPRRQDDPRDEGPRSEGSRSEGPRVASGRERELALIVAQLFLAARRATPEPPSPRPAARPAASATCCASLPPSIPGPPSFGLEAQWGVVVRGLADGVLQQRFGATFAWKPSPAWRLFGGAGHATGTTRRSLGEVDFGSVDLGLGIGRRLVGNRRFELDVELGGGWLFGRASGRARDASVMSSAVEGSGVQGHLGVASWLYLGMFACSLRSRAGFVAPAFEVAVVDTTPVRLGPWFWAAELGVGVTFDAR